MTKSLLQQDEKLKKKRGRMQIENFPKSEDRPVLHKVEAATTKSVQN